MVAALKALATRCADVLFVASGKLGLVSKRHRMKRSVAEITFIVRSSGALSTGVCPKDD